MALNYDQKKTDALYATYTKREKIEQELARKNEVTVNLMNEISKEEMMKFKLEQLKQCQVYFVI